MSHDWAFYEHLKLNGSGTIQIIADYSSSEGLFYYRTPAADSPENILVVQRVIVNVQDISMKVDEYGGLGAALANGLELVKRDAEDADTLDLFGGETVKSNGDWAKTCHDLQHHDFAVSTGPESMSVRYTFGRAGIPLILTPGQSLTMRVNDNFTGLDAHTVFAQGYWPFRVEDNLRPLFGIG